MRLKVNLLASDCRFDHACLENNGHKPCGVKNIVNEKVVFIKCEPRICGYNINFGYEKICCCPTRKEIFEKYQL